MPTLQVLLHGELPPEQALAGGQVTLEGDPAALRRFVQLFRLGQSASADPGQPPADPPDEAVARRRARPTASS